LTGAPAAGFGVMVIVTCFQTPGVYVFPPEKLRAIAPLALSVAL
jgi:hypothetical protein